MNASLRRPHFVPFVLALLGLAAGPGPAPAEQIHWRLYARGEEEPPAESGKRVPCGGYGIFYLEPDGVEPEPLPKAVAVVGSGPIGTIEPVLLGAEEPQRYPRPLLPPAEGSAESAAFFPCRGGSCFLPSTDSLTGGAWVAVIDWNNEHGWSVGWTIHQIAGNGVEMVLFPLADAELEPIATKGESDAHLLAQICRLVEAVERDGVTPPVVVNMSFGRLPRAEDLDPVPDCRGTASPRLSCQIRLALDHLASFTREVEGRAPVYVAAAGNHRQLLFPASAPGVVAAGSLQLGQFHKAGLARPSWETPLKADGTTVLLPGYGLCLFPDWPWLAGSGRYAPAGTSYAAGNTSGWAVKAVSQGLDLLADGAAVWRPERSCASTTCTYSMVRTDGARLAAGGPLSAVFEQIRRGSPRCAPAEDALTESGVLSPGSSVGTPENLPSLDEVAAVLGRKLPTPATSPCVPCMANSQSPPGYAAFWQGPIPGSPDGSVGLLVDSSGETNFPPAATLVGFLLRVGDRFLEIKLEGGLTGLLKPDLSSIYVGELGAALAAGDQPSLIYVLDDLETGSTYWTSIPLLLR